MLIFINCLFFRKTNMITRAAREIRGALLIEPIQWEVAKIRGFFWVRSIMANNPMQLDPFNEITRSWPLRSFEDFFRDLRARPMFGNFETEPQIKMDVSETEQSYTVKAEMPGVKKEDVKVAIDGNQITISGEAQLETEKKEGESVIRRERYFGVQSRSFTLAHDIDDSKATAKYDNGVLELHLPKKAGDGGTKLLPIS